MREGRFLLEQGRQQHFACAGLYGARAWDKCMCIRWRDFLSHSVIFNFLYTCTSKLTTGRGEEWGRKPHRACSVTIGEESKPLRSAMVLLLPRIDETKTADQRESEHT